MSTTEPPVLSKLPKKKKKKKRKNIPSSSPSPVHPQSSQPYNAYVAAAPPSISDTEPRLIQHVCAFSILLYKLSVATKERIDLGKRVLAVLPASNDSSPAYGQTTVTFNLTVFESKNRRVLLCIPLTAAAFKGFAILGNKSLSVLDSKTSDSYAFVFATEDALKTMVCACMMAKIPRNAIHSDRHAMAMQDLKNANHEPLAVNMDTRCADTLLSIWCADHERHPYRRGKCVYSGEKSIQMQTDKWIMPCIVDALKGMRVGLARFLVVPPRYAFGDKGNDKLHVLPNTTLLIEIELRSIEQNAPATTQYMSDSKLLQSISVRESSTSASLNAMEMSALRRENEKLKKEILRLNASMSAVLNENQRLKKIIDDHEIKTVQQRINLHSAIQTEKNELESKLNESGFDATQQWQSYELDIDYSRKHYLEWNSLDVVDWILSLSASFAKYASVLRKTMPQQNIKGNHLSKLDKIEWKALGMLDEDDCLSLLDNVKALTKQERKQWINNAEGFVDNFDPNNNLF